jgi:very-short-patch-repair endonuclease
MGAIEYDQRRTAHLIKLGYKVLRVWNNAVFNNIEGVLATILGSLESRAT